MANNPASGSTNTPYSITSNTEESLRRISQGLDNHVKKTPGHTLVAGFKKTVWEGTGGAKRKKLISIFTDSSLSQKLSEEKRFYSATNIVSVRLTYYLNGKPYARYGGTIRYDADGDEIEYDVKKINENF